MNDNVIDFHEHEETMMIKPTKCELGFNSEEGFMTITFSGDEEGSSISFILDPKDIDWLQSEFVRVKKLARIS